MRGVFGYFLINTNMFSYLHQLVVYDITSFVLMSSRSAFCYMLPCGVKSIKLNSLDYSSQLGKAYSIMSLYKASQASNHDIVSHYNIIRALPERGAR